MSFGTNIEHISIMTTGKVIVNVPQKFIFEADFDDEGVYFYQAYSHNIANWAMEHQKLGGPEFNPTRMTWIKPSLAWVLYRSGYARKRNQERILKVKLSHEVVAGKKLRTAHHSSGQKMEK